MSEIKVNKISPKQLCTQLTLGDSGDTIIIPAGATIQNSGTATGFGATGAVNWDTTPKTTTVTAVSGVGYFVDTTTTTLTVNLPVGTAGAIVAVSDYANTAATNNIAITPNGTDKIDGVNGSYPLATNGASITFVYVDSTRGWKDINDATLNAVGVIPFVAATGGTVTTCGNYKIHTFTGPGTFTVTNAGTPAGSNSVDYMIVAGGGGGGSAGTGGGGAGGYRESKATGAPWTASPLATSTSLPVSVQGYPITVGGGGAGNPFPSSPYTGTSGSNSVFSTITSTGGGGGGASANPGGSGGGGQTGGAGTGNTPPVSPPQGQSGGGSDCGAGGGGAGEAGNTDGIRYGGDGVSTSISGSPTFYAGGGGGGYGGGFPPIPGGDGGGGASGNSVVGVPGAGTTPGVAGTTNTGGGGGGGGYGCGRGGGAPQGDGGNGGSGILIIRYKFQ